MPALTHCHDALEDEASLLLWCGENIPPNSSPQRRTQRDWEWRTHARWWHGVPKSLSISQAFWGFCSWFSPLLSWQCLTRRDVRNLRFHSPKERSFHTFLLLRSVGHRLLDSNYKIAHTTQCCRVLRLSFIYDPTITALSNILPPLFDPSFRVECVQQNLPLLSSFSPVAFRTCRVLPCLPSKITELEKLFPVMFVCLFVCVSARLSKRNTLNFPGTLLNIASPVKELIKVLKSSDKIWQ